MAEFKSSTGFVAALGLIHAFGVNSMYGLVYRNGYIQALINLWKNGPYVLPGSDVPILTKFTGLRVLDNVLTLAGVMFANINDGSTPQLSLYAFHFAGQLVPILTVFMIEGRRRGNRGNIISLSVLWGCAMQGLGYGFVMPVYAIVHLLTSQTAIAISPQLATAIRTKDLVSVKTLSSSIVGGYILPSILMTVPLSSAVLHQWFGGLWQGAPVWVTLLQHCFACLPRNSDQASSKKGQPAQSKQLASQDRSGEMISLYRAYVFAFAVSAVTQLATFGIIGATKLFPRLFSHTLTFSDVFIPPKFYSVAPMKNMAIGIQNFFQYDQYVGSAAAIVWAAALHRKARKESMSLKHWIWLVGEVLGMSLIAGPGGALVSVMWNRDERIISDDDLYC